MYHQKAINMRNLRRNEVKDTEIKKETSFDNIQHLIHKDWKSLIIISTEGIFYFFYLD